MEENKRASRVTITMNPDLLKQLNIYCAENGMKKSAVIALALSKYLRKENNA